MVEMVSYKGSPRGWFRKSRQVLCVHNNMAIGILKLVEVIRQKADDYLLEILWKLGKTELLLRFLLELYTVILYLLNRKSSKVNIMVGGTKRKMYFFF